MTITMKQGQQSIELKNTTVDIKMYDRLKRHLNMNSFVQVLNKLIDVAEGKRAN